MLAQPWATCCFRRPFGRATTTHNFKWGEITHICLILDQTFANPYRFLDLTHSIIILIKNIELSHIHYSVI